MRKTRTPLWTAALCALLLCGLATACGGDEPAVTTPPDTNPPTAAPATSPAESPTEADTQAETEAPTPALSLTAEGCVVVLGDYATPWEKTAAEELAARLGTAVVADSAIPEGKAAVIIGYSDRNGDFLGDDPDAAMAEVGELGYVLRAHTDGVALVANTEAGLAACLAAFETALGEGSTLSADFESVHRAEAETVAEAELVGPWAENIAYASSQLNQVQTRLVGVKRTDWHLSNTNVSIHYAISGEKQYAAISTPAGIPYVTFTGDVYLDSAAGERFYSSDSRGTGHTNMYQFGYYYNNAHLLGTDFYLERKCPDLKSLYLDRTFHLYGDKLNTVQHLAVVGQDAKGLAGYGQIFTIPAERVKAIVVKDAGGLHHTLEGVDWSTCEYVAFDIERAGIFGYILVNDGTLASNEKSGTLTVTLADGVYTIDQHVPHNPEATLAKGTQLYFGQRIYTDTNHTFDAFLHEAECERNPLTDLSVTERRDGAGYAGYDALRGAYRFNIGGTDFNSAYYNMPNKYFDANLKIKGGDTDRKIYVYTHTASGALECAVLLDENKSLLPIPMEVGKNFTGENEESDFEPGDISFGQTFFPMVVKAGETRQCTVLNLYQNWGAFALKQLSSIRFVAPYYHLSLGVTETNCIAPNYVYGKDFWILPDFRGLSSPMWAGQPQHNALGCLYLCTWRDAKNKAANAELTDTVIDSAGPIYADVTNTYLTDQGNATFTYRHVEHPQTDENRTYYTIEVEFLEDVSFDNFRGEFSLFRFHGRGAIFGKIGYLNENNEQVIEPLDVSEEYDRILVLGKEAPYVDYFDCTNGDDVTNFGLIIKDWDITVGGEEFTGNWAVRDFLTLGQTFCDLSLDLGEVTFRAGDHISVDLILLPWGHSSTTVDDRNVRAVREDSVLNPYTLTVKTGEVVEDTFVPKVRATDDVAEFTLTGGDNIAALRVYGLSSYEKPAIQELVNGEWVDYDTTYRDNDGYYVYYDGDGTYSVAFAVDMTNAPAEGRTFRVAG